MTQTFFEKLTSRIEQANSLLCIGIDPHPEFLDEQSPHAVEEFCRRLIEETAEYACAFKPNSAFFEVFGPAGLKVLSEIIRAVPDEIPVILDAKRGDIGSTSQAYVKAIFETLGADAVTVNPYLGWDAIAPFFADPRKGVFLLCKTSNPGADEFQAQRGNRGNPLYLQLAQQAEIKNHSDNIGLVVGATDPHALAAVREVAPEIWILAPGVGAQGGDLQQAVQAGLREDGLGMILPISRSISRAEDPAGEAKELGESVNLIRQGLRRKPQAALPSHLAPLANGLLEAGCVRFGEFTLKSGIQSPFYLDLRRLSSFPNLLAKAASAYHTLLKGLEIDRLAAIPYAGIPIGTAISLQTDLPLVYPRKERKEYGTHSLVEGEYQEGEKVVVVDDLVTSGGSKIEAIQRLNSVGLMVEHIVVLIDREQGAGEFLKQRGYTLHSVFKLTGLLSYWESTNAVDPQQIHKVRVFLKQ